MSDPGEGGAQGEAFERPAAQPDAWGQGRRFWGVLLLLAVVAVLVRLLPVLYGGGLSGKFGHDDSIYFSAAIAFVEGRVPYRDFNLLHPPGIIYLLSPFAAIGGLTGDATAIGLARVAFMALGALNTILVALVARRLGLVTAVSAAALYAVWFVPVAWERTTYLIAPQSTLTLLALLLLARSPRELTTRRVALAGVCIGIAGMFQLWTAVTAVVIFGWLIATLWRVPARLVRLGAAYVAGGVVAAVALALPILIASGPRMIESTVLAQLERAGSAGAPRMMRLRMIEGIPLSETVQRLTPDALVIAALLIVASLVALAAWKRSEMRLWAVLLAAQMVFLMVTPVFFRHYAAWLAPAAALSIGATVAVIIDWLDARWRRPAAGVLAVGLVALLLVSLRPDSTALPVTVDSPDLRGVQCISADDAILLVKNGGLRRNLQRNCPVLLNPTGLIHLVKVRTGGDPNRKTDPEYQLAMQQYFGGSDAAMFIQRRVDRLTPETWASIRASLPYRIDVGDVIVLLREQP